MRASLRYSIDVDSEAELNKIRQAGHDFLADQAKVTASSSALEDEQFTVFGAIKGKPAESYREVVRAQDAEEAKVKALEADEKRTAVVALPGDVAS